MTPQQAKYYKLLKSQLLIEADGEEVSAVNAAVKINKLLQISCIAAGTQVLTKFGWRRIEDITSNDAVWDGEDWVSCGGAVFKGYNPTILLDGVRLTPEHKVLTVSGWAEAKDCVDGEPRIRFNRVEVRIPDGYSEARDNNRESQKSNVALPMLLWQESNPGVAEPSIQTPPECEALRMPPWRAYSDTPYVRHKTLYDMGENAKALQQPERQRLQKLRSARDKGMQTLGQKFWSLLGGYAKGVLQRVNDWPHGQQWALFPGQLPVGDYKRAEQQYTQYSVGEYPCWGNERGKRRQTLWAEDGYATCATGEVQMAHKESSSTDSMTAVYDVLNCGPRSRFVVRGSDGGYLIAHNCGAVYTDTGETLEFDVSNRLTAVQEVIEEASHKTLVFVPFNHTIKLLQDHLVKNHISCDVINGEVSMNQRSEIIQRFQTGAEPKVLLIQPQAASHGITLTAANNIIWYAPVTSVETYLQANARINRPGQVNRMLITHICGSEVEARLYRMLQTNITNHAKIVDLYRQELTEVA
jgi:hypothetical protein